MGLYISYYNMLYHGVQYVWVSGRAIRKYFLGAKEQLAHLQGAGYSRFSRSPNYTGKEEHRVLLWVREL